MPELKNGTSEGARMNLKQNTIKNWLELAKKSNWSATALAKNCNVSLRTLQRHFLKQVGMSPKIWISEQRQQQAKIIVNSGYSVKEASLQLGYNHANQFSRDFKRYWGCQPTNQKAALLSQNRKMS